MDKRQELVKQTAARLNEINSVDEMRATEEEVFILMETLFKSCIDAFSSFIDNMDGIPESELHAKALVFQEESFLLPPEIMAQLERMENMQGDKAYINAYSEEMEKKLDPYIDQFGSLSEKLLDKLLNNIIGKNGNEMEEVDGVPGGDTEQKFVFDYDDISTPRMMYELYSSPTLEDLDLEVLIDDMEEQLQNDVWELETMTDESYGEPSDDDLERISEIRIRMKVYEAELDKELIRVGKKSGKTDEAEALKKEILSKVSLKVREIKHYLTQL